MQGCAPPLSGRMFRGCEPSTARLNFQSAPTPPSVLCRIGMGSRNSGAIRQSDAGHGARSDCALGGSIVNPVVRKRFTGTLQGAGRLCARASYRAPALPVPAWVPVGIKSGLRPLARPPKLFWHGDRDRQNSSTPSQAKPRMLRRTPAECLAALPAPCDHLRHGRASPRSAQLHPLPQMQPPQRPP